MTKFVLASIVSIVLLFTRLTFVKESTAKAVVRFGGFQKILVRMSGYRMATQDEKIVDDDGYEEEYKKGDMIPVEDTSSATQKWVKRWFGFGGLRIVGIRFIDTLYRYNFRWNGMKLVDGVERVEFQEVKNIDYIFLRPDVYVTDIQGAETRPPERIALDLRFLVTIRVVNPEKALFQAPSNWFENVMTRLNSLLRDWVASVPLDEILKLKKAPEAIWKGFTFNDENGDTVDIPGMRDDPLLKVFRNEWGVKIERNGIEIRAITPPKDIQEAAQAERKQEFTAKGYAAETTGRMVAMIAALTGQKMKDIQDEFRGEKNATGYAGPAAALLKYRDLIEMNQDLIKRRLGLGAGQQEIFTKDPAGFLLALFSRIAGGNSPSSGSRKPEVIDVSASNRGKKKDGKDDDDDGDPDEGWEIK